MIAGIGVDTVDIDRIRRILGESAEPGFRKISAPGSSCGGERPHLPENAGEPAFLAGVFSEQERAAAPSGKARAEYFAARFACKEAVFKAVAHLLPEKHFDLRQVETLRDRDGSPYVVMDGALGDVYRRAGVGRIHVSITTEDHFATAFVIAET